MSSAPMPKTKRKSKVELDGRETAVFEQNGLEAIDTIGEGIDDREDAQPLGKRGDGIHVCAEG